MYSACLRLVLPHIRSCRGASDPSLYNSMNPELNIKDLVDTIQSRITKEAELMSSVLSPLYGL